MSQRLLLLAEKRTKPPKGLRRQGLIPAVVYGRGKEVNAVQVEDREFHKVWAKAGMTSLIDIKIEEEKIPVLIREVQFHPVQNNVLHADFYRVRMDEKIEAEVPLKFVGVAPAVKDQEGVLVRSLDALQVKALPQDLPHEIEVDISSLTDFEKVIQVRTITLPSGVETLHGADEVVALVQPPRSAEELAELTSEVKEDVEAVEGVKKEEAPAEATTEVEQGAAEKDQKDPKKDTKKAS